MIFGNLSFVSVYSTLTVNSAPNSEYTISYNDVQCRKTNENVIVACEGVQSWL